MKFMSMVIAVLLYAAFAGWANADVQINQQQQYVHAPYDVDNTDNELYVGPIATGTPANVQYNGTQSVSVTEQTYIRLNFQPPELVDLPAGEFLHLNSTESPNEQCTITDVNGDARQANYWEVAIRKMNNNGLFTVNVNCSDRWD